MTLLVGGWVARRNVLHYVLGNWMALVSAGALLLSDPGPYWVLAGAGGGAYLIAVFLCDPCSQAGREGLDP